MAISVTKFPQTTTQTGSGVDWTGTLELNDQDDGYEITLPMTSDANSKVLVGSNFGFTIPTNATIKGIEAIIRRIHSVTTSPYPSEITTQLRKAGTAVGDNKASGNYTNAWLNKTYGGATDLWGTTWTPADINNSGFGLGHVLYRYTTASGDPYIDCFKITVYYTIPINGNILIF